MIHVNAFIVRFWNRVYRIIHSIFSTLEVILHRLKVRLPIYWQNHMFAAFEIRFTPLSVLFLKYWKLSLVNWRYGCQDTNKTFYLPAFLSSLQHYLFYFLNIGGYLTSLGGTDAKIQVKSFILRFWNRVYGIIRSIFTTLEVILRWKGTISNIREKNFILQLWN